MVCKEEEKGTSIGLVVNKQPLQMMTIMNHLHTVSQLSPHLTIFLSAFVSCFSCFIFPYCLLSAYLIQPMLLFFLSLACISVFVVNI